MNSSNAWGPKFDKDSTPYEVLKAEAEWLRTAYENSFDKRFTKDFRDGFDAAIGWVERHAEQAKEKTETITSPEINSINDYPLTTVGELIHKSSENIYVGPVKALCRGAGYNLALDWKLVTCPKCLSFN